MPVFVRVTNLENGRSIVVRVNDRGPFANGRIIDMSRRGAQLLGFEQKGTARVRVQYIENAPLEGGTMVAQGDEPQPQVAAAPRGDIGVQTLAPPPTLPPAKAATPPKPAPPQLQPASQPAPQARAVAVAEIPPDYTAQTVRVEPVKQTNIYIQAGAFTVYDNANRQSAKIGRLGPTRVSQTVVNGTDFYRVRLGPIESVDRADQLLNQIIAGGDTQAHIVVE
jgi:rare lipoprotein A